MMTMVLICGWLSDFQGKGHTPLVVPLKPSVCNGETEDLFSLTVPSGIKGIVGAEHFSGPQVPTTLIGSCEK